MLLEETETSGTGKNTSQSFKTVFHYRDSRKLQKNPKYIFFDFETWQHPADGLIPNAVVAQYSDGTEFRFPKDGEPMTSDVMEEFGRWLYQYKHRGYTIITHNFGSFDSQFVLRHMMKNNMKVQAIKRGTQLLEIEYARMKMRSRDTLNFCALRLDQFPKSVGLAGIAAKWSFPHRVKKP